MEARLDAGERVEWCGQPRQGVMFRPIDAYLIPFSLVWAGLPTGAFVAAVASGQLSPDLLFLLLFVVLGQYLTWGRFVIDRSVRKGLYYAVTDTRCMIVGTRWRRLTRTYARGRGDYELVEHRNGRGTVRFVTGSWFSGRRSPWGDWFSSFEQIPDATAVYRLVRMSAPSSHGRPAPAPRVHPRPDNGLS